MICFDNVSKVYGKGSIATYALKGVDLMIGNGEFVAIMGASGSGKSTTMNIIGSLDVPTDGEYRFANINAGRLDREQRAMFRRKYLGFIFQGFNLLGRTTARENVELPLLYRGESAKNREKKALEALEIVGLSSVANHTPAELSGGQQQRVAIARAIVTNPAVLLADEPTGNLDTARSFEIMEIIKELNTQKKITVVMVTHEDEMAKYADRVIVFSDGLKVSDGY